MGTQLVPSVNSTLILTLKATEVSCKDSAKFVCKVVISGGRSDQDSAQLNVVGKLFRESRLEYNVTKEDTKTIIAYDLATTPHYSISDTKESSIIIRNVLQYNVSVDDKHTQLGCVMSSEECNTLKSATILAIKGSKHFTPNLTRCEWELLFKTGDLWGINEEGYDHYISASKDITLSSLDINLRYLILYIICPLFKSVNAISECQIQISKIAVLQTELENLQFDIWDTMEAHIVIIARHCKLLDYFQRKCTTIKNAKFKRCLSQENRKYILEDVFKNPIFIQDREFCELTRKELELIKFEDNLKMADTLLGREITIELEDGKYEIGSYSRRVIDIADKDLNIRKAVSSNQKIGSHTEKIKDIQERINKHNHLKLVQLITSFGQKVLVDFLKDRLPDAEFGYAFSGMKDRIFPLLDNHERQLLYPDKTHYKGDLSDLDISHLYTILRNLNTICPHKNGWGNIPNEDDRGMSANIDRIRIFKNVYVSHFSYYSLNEEDFLKTWKEIRQCILQLGGNAYTKKIDSLLTSEN
ncbi:unnamed protein product [Mytilus coruscus]|uniref:DZIP3-like HEPN domain-containing protein n=1 Tax=Mytilus coruscus TaxID=42192 RepID=A0A6J8CKR3_MYTCO|nr:unnamed protein product [Mytilus coruscus]